MKFLLIFHIFYITIFTPIFSKCKKKFCVRRPYDLFTAGRAGTARKGGWASTGGLKVRSPVPPQHITRSGPVSPNQGQARRPMRGRLEEHLDHLNIWGEAGGIVWVNPSPKCASCHSNETGQRNIHTHVNVSSKAYVYDETIYNSCARARFAGCTFLRHIILGLNTVYMTFGARQLCR
jgi:hypothetical protein